MVGSITKNLLEFLKLTPRYLVSLGIATSFLLFSPKNVLQYLRIYNFTQDYRQWISILLILSVALLAVSIAIEAMQVIKHWWNKKKFYNRMSKRLNNLTEDEKQILRYYIANQTKSNVLKFDDGIVQGLVAKDIIRRASSLGNLLEGFPYNISEFAWEYLNEDPWILEGTTETCRTDKMKDWI